MGNVFDPKGKTTAELLQEMFKLAGEPETISGALKMAMEVRIWDQIFHTITETRKEFIDQTQALSESIDQFRKSTERTSKILNRFTMIIAAMAVLQVGLLIYKNVCP
jgi:hypothetical protein